MTFPKISEVAFDLRAINREVEADEDGWYVRLQLYPAGDWAVRFGLPDYDQDHLGYWGTSTIPGNSKRFPSKDVARDLISQVKDAYYEVNS